MLHDTFDIPETFSKKQQNKRNVSFDHWMLADLATVSRLQTHVGEKQKKFEYLLEYP